MRRTFSDIRQTYVAADASRAGSEATIAEDIADHDQSENRPDDRSPRDANGLGEELLAVRPRQRARAPALRPGWNVLSLVHAFRPSEADAHPPTQRSAQGPLQALLGGAVDGDLIARIRMAHHPGGRVVP